MEQILKSIQELQMIEYLPYIVLLWKLIIEKSKIKYVLFCLINFIINTILKNIIKEPRPRPTMKYGELQKYGMPSGHSQMIWFSLFYNFKLDWQHIIMFCLALISSLQRISINYHSFNQVLVGGIVGLILACIVS